MKPGSRFTDGDYQAPATAAAAITRGRPLRSHRWTIGRVQAELQLVPLEGGRPEFFEVALQTNDLLRGHSVYIPCMLRGEQLARDAYRLTATELDAGRLPDRILLPPDAPLGW